jgi:branched-chain amino acid transport system substrate-binding protein
VVGYSAMHTVAAALRKAGSTDPEKLIASLKGLELETPFGPIVYRPLDHQSTMGAYIGQLARKGGRGVMVNWRYADGADFQPPIEEVRALRKE